LIRIILSFLLTTVALGCGEDHPLGPRRPLILDLTPLVDLLNDPLVRLMPATIDDPAFVTPLQAELASLRKSSEAGQVAAVRRTLASTRAATKRYDDRSDIDPGNRVVLAAIQHVLDRAEVILEDLVAGSGMAETTTATVDE
jgi:hypothetical protein